MQSERDALLKLIQSLRHEYEAVQAAKMGQESEIQGLKVKPSCLLVNPVGILHLIGITLSKGYKMQAVKQSHC